MHTGDLENPVKNAYFYGMKKMVFLLFAMVAMASCSNKIEPSDLAKINGYWEIEKVVLPDGQQKDYKVNTVYDYFEIKSNKGFRKKVMPQFDGKFLANDLDEKIEIVTHNGKTEMRYTTPYARWNEQLLKIEDSIMVVENQDKKIYHYKRATALNLTGDVQKTR